MANIDPDYNDDVLIAAVRAGIKQNPQHFTTEARLISRIDTALKRAEQLEGELETMRDAYDDMQHFTGHVQCGKRLTEVLKRAEAAEAALADMTHDYHRWHKAFMDAKYPEILPTRHDLELTLASRDEALREAREAMGHLCPNDFKSKRAQGYAEKVWGALDNWYAVHAPTAAPTGEPQHGT